MFLKFFDDLELQRETESKLAGRKFKPAAGTPCCWRDWAATGGGLMGDEWRDVWYCERPHPKTAKITPRPRPYPIRGIRPARRMVGQTKPNDRAWKVSAKEPADWQSELFWHFPPSSGNIPASAPENRGHKRSRAKHSRNRRKKRLAHFFRCLQFPPVKNRSPAPP